MLPEGTSRAVRISPKSLPRPRHWAEAMPAASSRKYGRVYDGEGVNDLVAAYNTAAVGKIPVLQVTGDQLHDVIQTLSDAGVVFYIKSAHRNWANTWIGQNYGQVEEVPEAPPAGAENLRAAA